jgi:hypothetical protein
MSKSEIAIPALHYNGRETRPCFCLPVGTGSPGSAYIAHVKLTTMTTPDFSTSIYHDSTNLTSTTATCYTVKIKKQKPKIGGTTTLSLKMVFGSASNTIVIGGVRLMF